MRVVTAPSNDFNKIEDRVFLAGSIEMDKAERWQDKVIEMFKDTDFTILNPRRDDWDSSWEQKADNPKFREQVEWEMLNLCTVDFILFYFSPETISPISLLELGRFSNSFDTVVVCPKGYFRKGNIDLFCEFDNITQVSTLEDAVAYIKKELK